MHNLYHNFTTWLHAHPQWGAVVAFVAAFAESIPIIGSVIPGSVTMTAIGIFVGSGIMSLKATLICAVVGAIVGDSVGLFIGYYFKENLKNIWPFKKYPKWLESGEKFIGSHGGKSVFVGRFVGLVRPYVPLVAGMLRMPIIRFYLIDIISAIGWAIAYMLPGFLVGIASLSVPPGMATEVILAILGVLVLLWLITWFLHFTSKKIYYTFNHIMDGWWRRLKAHHRHPRLYSMLKFPENEHAGQLAMASLSIILIILFIIVWLNVIFHGPLIRWNLPFYHFFRGLHFPLLTDLMLVITTFGEKIVILPISFTFFLWFVFRKQWRVACHYLALAIIVATGVFIIKHLHYNPRPTGLFNSPSNSSFPSGHTALAVALYGFISYLLVSAKFAWRKWIYWITAIICILIALSRLYLGAHWLTDVLGSALFAGVCLSIIVISYRRITRPKLSFLSVLLVPVITLACTATWYLDTHFSTQVKNYQLTWPHMNMNEASWWNNNNLVEVPLYRNTRFGHPAEVLNVQWAGSISNITVMLADQGWQKIPVKRFITLFKEIGENNTVQQIAISDKLTEDQLPALIAAKTNKNGQTAILFLWPANITLTPENTPLWIGTLYYHKKHKIHFFRHGYSTPGANYTLHNWSAVQVLASTLTKAQHKILRVSTNQLPSAFSQSGELVYEILLVKSS